jgi:hypothetical protein
MNIFWSLESRSYSVAEPSQIWQENKRELLLTSQQLTKVNRVLVPDRTSAVSILSSSGALDRLLQQPIRLRGAASLKHVELDPRALW